VNGLFAFLLIGLSIASHGLAKRQDYNEAPIEHFDAVETTEDLRDACVIHGLLDAWPSPVSAAVDQQRLAIRHDEESGIGVLDVDVKDLKGLRVEGVANKQTATTKARARRGDIEQLLSGSMDLPCGRDYQNKRLMTKTRTGFVTGRPFDAGALGRRPFAS